MYFWMKVFLKVGQLQRKPIVSLIPCEFHKWNDWSRSMMAYFLGVGVSIILTMWHGMSDGMACPPSPNKAAKILYFLTCHLDHPQQWHLAAATRLDPGLKFNYPLTLIKATLCHSSRCASLGKWHDCPHSPLLPRICCTSFTFRQYSLSSDRPCSLPEADGGYQGFHPWSSFRECTSATSAASKTHAEACPVLAQFSQMVHRLHKKIKIPKLHENRAYFQE